jgi:hypothetical protein
MLSNFLNASVDVLTLLFSFPISYKVYKLVHGHFDDLLLVGPFLYSDIPEQLGRSYRERGLFVGILGQFVDALYLLLHKLLRWHLSESLHKHLNLIILEHDSDVRDDLIDLHLGLLVFLGSLPYVINLSFCNLFLINVELNDLL